MILYAFDSVWIHQIPGMSSLYTNILLIFIWWHYLDIFTCILVQGNHKKQRTKMQQTAVVSGCGRSIAHAMVGSVRATATSKG